MALLGALCATAHVHAAGGHHAVDDAAILDAGQCELEGWFTRAQGGERLLHAGAGCRVGPVELGVASEHARTRGAGSATGWGVSAKWATALSETLSIGFSAGPAWQAHVRPRYQGVTAAALVTWFAIPDVLALHANLGRDFVHRGGDMNRSGVSAEWFPAAGWSLVGERYAEAQSHFARVGVRKQLNDRLTLDASHAHRISGPGVSATTFGITWLLER